MNKLNNAMLQKIGSHLLDIPKRSSKVEMSNWLTYSFNLFEEISEDTNYTLDELCNLSLKDLKDLYAKTEIKLSRVWISRR